MSRKYILQLESTVELAILNIEEITESDAISTDELLSVLHDEVNLLQLMGNEKNLICRTFKTLDGQMVAQMFHRNGQLIELSVCPSVLNLCKAAVEQIVGDIRRPPSFNPISCDKAVLEALSNLAERFQCERCPSGSARWHITIHAGGFTCVVPGCIAVCHGAWIADNALLETTWRLSPVVALCNL